MYITSPLFFFKKIFYLILKTEKDSYYSFLRQKSSNFHLSKTSIYSLLQNIEHDSQIYIANLPMPSKIKTKQVFSIHEERHSNNCANKALT